MLYRGTVSEILRLRFFRLSVVSAPGHVTSFRPEERFQATRKMSRKQGYPCSKGGELLEETRRVTCRELNARRCPVLVFARGFETISSTSIIIFASLRSAETNSSINIPVSSRRKGQSAGRITPLFKSGWKETVAREEFSVRSSGRSWSEDEEIRRQPPASAVGVDLVFWSDERQKRRGMGTSNFHGVAKFAGTYPPVFLRVKALIITNSTLCMKLQKKLHSGIVRLCH